MDINDAVEISSRGYNNTLNNAQRILIDAYIQIVLEDEEHIGDIVWAMDITNMFEQLLNQL